MVRRRSGAPRSRSTCALRYGTACRQHRQHRESSMRPAGGLVTRRWTPAQGRGFDWMAAAPLSLAYAGLLAARSAWWERYARTSPLPVVSVGNLTIGGNGKTPFALFLAARLRQCGLRPGIVSRGYGGQASRAARLVSDGRYIVMTPRE